MSLGQHRKIYQSENGNSWWLCREQGAVFVLHEANVSSDFVVTRVELSQFLSSGGKTPEKQALVEMIGGLTQCEV
jgi:hypothetical protein